ncbi:cyclodeaminase/cyclohydrolase family protein [Clostridium sp. D2Q-11]|uniref:Cyclodeaminase/cyclohydrolase family protein n=1 Tax=Anaeromonas frigoriresistens TaxID=2683708 RepID=A0A942Z6Q2_9FIRM|nr:cyclodeaminase/cyclohydrolase family protein [Anaeromonas frigoriresistens]MBS4538716.1 cyclodeaminase/cyclohydrolase family protein [Anaeromonas frigoriresistens]
MLQDLNLKDFLEKTGSNSPVPGGGSAAALTASLSASLVEMVSNLTVGKKKYEEVNEEMEEIKKIAMEMRKKFLNDIDRDSESFNGVMAAFKLPKETDEEKNTRKELIQKELKNAALIPLEIAKNSYKILDISEKVVIKGNQNAVTDGLVATMLARTAVLSALYNVKINLISIKDEEFIKQVTEEMDKLSDVNKREESILKKVEL